MRGASLASGALLARETTCAVGLAGPAFAGMRRRASWPSTSAVPLSPTRNPSRNESQREARAPQTHNHGSVASSSSACVQTLAATPLSSWPSCGDHTAEALVAESSRAARFLQDAPRETRPASHVPRAAIAVQGRPRGRPPYPASRHPSRRPSRPWSRSSNPPGAVISRETPRESRPAKRRPASRPSSHVEPLPSPFFICLPLPLLPLTRARAARFCVRCARSIVIVPPAFFVGPVHI